MQGSINTVESIEPGLSDLNRVMQEPINVEEIMFFDSDLGKATVWAGDSLLGMESSSRTQKWHRTFELAAKAWKPVDEDIGGFRIDQELH